MKIKIYYLITGITTILLSSYIFKINSDDYLIVNNDPSTCRYYQYGKSSYMDYFLAYKYTVNNLEYYVRVRKYSFTNSDTAYFRKGEENYYSYNKESQKESIIIPIVPTQGQKWFEADSSWSYEVIKVNQTFKTPIKKYHECILVECKQLTNRDKLKSQTYHLYYSKGNGYVGNVNVTNGTILSYLKEVVHNAKPGTVVGK